MPASLEVRGTHTERDASYVCLTTREPVGESETADLESSYLSTVFVFCSVGSIHGTSGFCISHRHHPGEASLLLPVLLARLGSAA